MFGYNNAKISGTILRNGEEVAKTRQCVHCAMHYVSVQGSGKVRGFCTKCMGPTCGKAMCNRCLPYEAQLEWIEAKSGMKTGHIKKLMSKYPDILLIQ